MLKNFVWKSTADETQAANTVEAALLQLIDDKLRISSLSNIVPFINRLQHAKTEPERALVLVILRGTSLCDDVKLSKTCISAYEKCGGLKLAKRWLEEAVEWSHTDLLVLLLEVLKTLPLQLTSITEAKINEPIVNLRKNAREEKVKRTAQDLLKYWRTKFTEKAKPQASALVAAAPPQSTVKPAAPTPSSTADKPTSSTSTTAPVPAPVSTPAKPADVSPTKIKPIKKRAIKRLEKLPYGGGTSVSKSTDLIGNLMQRKSAKDAAAAAKPKNDSLMQKLSAKEIGNESKPSKSASPPPAEAKDDGFTMQLPTIQSFNAAVSTASKRIRWADEAGKELVKVKFIESWRDLILHDPNQNEESFRDAKLREHADERNAMKSHKESEKFSVTVTHEWSAPALLKLPEPLEKRRHPVLSDEVAIQRARTRREMEYLVLDGEIPPSTPKEWVPSPNDLQRGPPIEIPLSDVSRPQIMQFPHHLTLFFSCNLKADLVLLLVH